MEQTAFVMKNVPDDKDCVLDFVEANLDCGVKHMEYSPTSSTTALVIVNKANLALPDIITALKDYDEYLDLPLKGPLEVFDAGHRQDALIVYNVNEEILSLYWLKLYLQSTFADGHEIVSECRFLSDTNSDNKAVIVTFNRPDEVPSILQLEDQVPLPSFGNYIISIKPFYKHLEPTDFSEERDRHKQYMSDTDEMNCPDRDLASCQKQAANACDVGAGHVSGTLDADEMNCPDRDPASCQEQAANACDVGAGHVSGTLDADERNRPDLEEIGKETLKLHPLKWKFLKSQLKNISGCNVDYSKHKEVLMISGINVGDKKSCAIELAEGVDITHLQLSELEYTFLDSEKVKDKLNCYITDECNDLRFSLKKSTLTLCGMGDIAEALHEIRGRFLKTVSLEISEEVPKEKIRDFQSIHTKYDMVKASFDSNKYSLTLLGRVEDVSYAESDIKNELGQFVWKDDTFTLEGNVAEYVQGHKMEQLENILREASITEKNIERQKISLRYKCLKKDRACLKGKLKHFQDSMEETEMELGEFDAEEVKLIVTNVTNLGLEEFQKTHKCCIFVDENENGTASKCDKKYSREGARPKNKTPDDSSHSDQQNRVFMLSSCTIKILSIDDITNDQSDLLVCSLPKNLHLKKTRVGQSFKKMKPSLQQDLNDNSDSFSQNGVFTYVCSLPRSKTQAIAFVVLDVWQQGVSDQKLNAAVIEVLETANEKGLTSVCFPAMGIGRAFQFPNDAGAQVVVNAIHNFLTNQSNNVKEINLIARGGYLTEIEKAIKATVNQPVITARRNQKPTHPPVITIVSDKKDMGSTLKDTIKKSWLNVDYFSRSDFSITQKFVSDMAQKAASMNVILTKEEDSTTNRPVCKIKGRMNDVQKMKDKFNDEVLRIKDQRNILFSPDAPKRGTVDFIKHASDCSNQFPPNWKLTWDDFNKGQQKTEFHMVDSSVYQKIEGLVLNTWETGMVGRGADARNIVPNSGVKVVDVERIENPILFLKYFAKRSTILNEMKSRDLLCADVGQLPGSKGQSKAMTHLDDAMKQELVHEINEQYLFHGTKKEIVNSIVEQGLDNRLSSSGGMLGQGVYTAESSTKADQYTDDRGNRLPNGSNLTMFLIRVVLGEVFILGDNHESVQAKDSIKLKRPPCMSCLKDICPSDCQGKGRFYHSVVADGKWLFREFVVYNIDQCYPEYRITYQRCDPGS